MNLDTFLRHHGLARNPFDAEEARYDPVFEKLMDGPGGHPDFNKILGRLDRPSTAVVFGEKGSGKTAIRLTIAKRVAEHNAANPTQQTLVIAYDDLNPVLDRLTHRRRSELGFHRAAKSEPEELLRSIRLQDHQDAILSQAVTRVVDALIESEDASGEHALRLPGQPAAIAKSLPYSRRVDLAALAALYDQPRSGAVAQRWERLRTRLRLSRLPMFKLLGAATVLWLITAAALGGMARFGSEQLTLKATLAAVAGVMALLTGAAWLKRLARSWSLARAVRRDLVAVDREPSDLRAMLLDFPPAQFQTVPWPRAGEQDARYELTRKLLAILEPLGYRHILVLVDRVDEPTLVHGRTERMKPIIWPMFDHKFLQQERIGIKLLLPIELRHELHRESASFFQEARMDKQSMIDRLSWSGATLYDLASARMRVCRASAGSTAAGDTPPSGAVAGAGSTPSLMDLFAQDVTREVIVDALDQMHQPRDAFKFLYQVLMEHCTTVSDEQGQYRVPRLTLETVRRQQSQRVQDLSRGVAPA